MKRLRGFYIVIFILITHVVIAAPGFEEEIPDPLPQSGGGGGTSVPIDDGIVFFLLAAAGAGSWLLGKKKKSV